MIAKYDDNGRYVWIGNQGVGDLEPNTYVGIVNPDTHYHDIATNTPTEKPPRPSEYHDFDYTTKEWAINPDRAWQEIRIKRDQLLSSSDWMVTKAIETGQPMPSGWASHRQALRDVTNQPDPMNIVWPVEPATP